MAGDLSQDHNQSFGCDYSYLKAWCLVLRWLLIAYGQGFSVPVWVSPGLDGKAP